jgi:amidase
VSDAIERNNPADAMDALRELTSAPAEQLARLIRDGEVSAVEAVEAHIERIADVNGALNAVVQVDAKRAVKAAQAADRARAGGAALGPLHGVPFTAKDNFLTAGVVTAVGVRERAAAVPSEDAAAVARMRAAGAILLGKTNCPPGGAGSFTDTELYGRTNNPYDFERTPGGSSGGEAAIIAAGGSPCGLGNDSGGSLRQPAHFCGIACIKPTAGLVPVTGVIDDEGELGAISDPRTQVGPLARTVADVALVLSVIAGPGRREPDVPPVALGDAREVELTGLRALVVYESDFVTPTDDTVAAVAAAVSAVADAGVVAEEGALPGGGHELTREIWASYLGRMSSADAYRLFRRWDAYRRRMLEFLQPYDLILSPAFDRPAPRHDEVDERGTWDGVSYTTPFSLTGWPAAIVRAGTAGAALPLGVQIVARAWHDRVALAAAACVEAALGGWRPPPPP